MKRESREDWKMKGEKRGVEDEEGE